MPIGIPTICLCTLVSNRIKISPRRKERAVQTFLQYDKAEFYDPAVKAVILPRFLLSA